MSSKYTTIVRRNREIIIDKEFLQELYDTKHFISTSTLPPHSAFINKTSYNKKLKKTQVQYVGTLKNLLGIAEFKNGNNLDFRRSNLVYKK